MKRKNLTDSLSLCVMMSIILLGCQPDSSPRILPPVIANVPLQPDLNVPLFLQSGAQAILPSFDGDSFYISFPGKSGPTTGQISAKDVFDKTVTPVLRAIDSSPDSLPSRPVLEENFVIPAQGIRMGASFENLTKLTCTVFWDAQRKHKQQKPETLERTKRICDVLLGNKNADNKFNNFFRQYMGMEYSKYVKNVKNDLDRKEVQFFFPQRYQGIVIEHVGIRAVGREDQTITSVSGRVFTRPLVITNKIELTKRDAAERGPRVLIDEFSSISSPHKVELKDVDLLLLPYGKVGKKTALRYAYRMPIVAQYKKTEGLFYLWLDAERGKILELQSLVYSVVAEGNRFDRSPDFIPLTTAQFEVGPADENGQFWLKYVPFSNLYPPMSIYETDKGGSSSFANFKYDQPEKLECNNDGDGQANFQRVDLMATLSLYKDWALNSGLVPFSQNPGDPTHYPISVSVKKLEENPDNECNSYGTLTTLSFLMCKVGSSPKCGDADINPKVLRTSYDHTIVAHELGHAFTQHQYGFRGSGDSDWCLGPSLESRPGAQAEEQTTTNGDSTTVCPLPTGNGIFHDFADSWAHALENTNCVADWAAKMMRSPPSPSECAGDSESEGWPRKSEVQETFDPINPGDHFPEHRQKRSNWDPNGNSHTEWQGWQGGYADMQIAGAALWAVREWMQRQDPVQGTQLFFWSFVRALTKTGWFPVGQRTTLGFVPLGNSDVDIFRGLLDLEIKLLEQLNGLEPPYSAQVVTAGFARAGIFLIPSSCIDGDSQTNDPGRCPEGDSGADAVIAPDKNDLRTFHVWTGPRYLFKDGGAIFPPTALCNPSFEVQVANEDALTVNSGRIDVNRDFSNPSPQCYSTWQIPNDKGQWDLLSKGGRIYYKVTTYDEQRKNERISLQPGNGLFQMAPPSIVVQKDMVTS